MAVVPVFVVPVVGLVTPVVVLAAAKPVLLAGTDGFLSSLGAA